MPRAVASRFFARSLLGDSKRVAAEHYVYALTLTDYREVDPRIALARAKQALFRGGSAGKQFRRTPAWPFAATIADNRLAVL